MANETLKDFIGRRRRDIENEAAPLRERLTILDGELEELRVAEMAISGRIPPPGLLGRAPTAEPRAPRGVIKKAVLKILSDTPTGLDAMSILSELNRRLGTAFQRTSLSPQLSRLKADGLVHLDGNLWLITNAGGHIAHWPVDLQDEDKEDGDEAF